MRIIEFMCDGDIVTIIVVTDQLFVKIVFCIFKGFRSEIDFDSVDGDSKKLL